jgi:perosamine synthetase
MNDAIDNSKMNNNYRDRIIDIAKYRISTFDYLKKIDSISELYLKGIKLESNQGILLPLTDLHLEDNELIQTLTDWRNKFVSAYPTRFKASFESTKNWISNNLLNAADRILFLIVNKTGKVVGHIGLSNGLGLEGGIEIDNVVRGLENNHKGIMSEALLTLIKWIDATLKPNEIYLRVLSDNTHAIDFYKKNDFVIEYSIPLKKVHDNHIEKFIECDFDSPDKSNLSFLKMIYNNTNTYTPESVILTAGPLISAQERVFVADAVSNGWNKQWSSYLNSFESEFAKYISTRFAISTSSGTGALHIALLALGIGPGDEVIVPDLTWVATANAVTYTGAKPIFADIQENTWCLDPDSFKSKITNKTKAVIPVHLYGHPADMIKINEIAQIHNIKVVEDAAPSLGSSIGDRKTGIFGDFSMFSFQGAKLLVTGEGGMLITDSEDLYNRAKQIWDQGRDPNKTFWINSLGWKYKMSNVQAALGLGQLHNIDSLIYSKRVINEIYYQNLKDVEEITVFREAPWAYSNNWMTSIILNRDCNIQREVLRSELRKMNIDTRPVFPAISQYPIWDEVNKPNPVSKYVGDNAINLPSGVCLTQKEILYICDSIKKCLSTSSIR